MTSTSTAWLADEARKLGAPAHVVELVRLGAPLVRLAPGTRTPLDRGWPQLAARHYVLRQVIDGHRQDSIDFGVCCGLPWAPGALIPDGHGLVVLDIEAEFLGAVPSWPTTPTAISRSGGRHVYLSLPISTIAALKGCCPLHTVDGIHVGDWKSWHSFVAAPTSWALDLTTPIATSLPSWVDAARLRPTLAISRGAHAVAMTSRGPHATSPTTRGASASAGAPVSTLTAARWPRKSPYGWALTAHLDELATRIDSHAMLAMASAPARGRSSALFCAAIGVMYAGPADLATVRAALAAWAPSLAGAVAAYELTDPAYLARTVGRAIEALRRDDAEAVPARVVDDSWLAYRSDAAPAYADMASVRFRVVIDGEAERRTLWAPYQLPDGTIARGSLRQLVGAAWGPNMPWTTAPTVRAGQSMRVRLSSTGRLLRALPSRRYY